jgi:hypothetical protein
MACGQGTFLGMSTYLKISAHPHRNFCVVHRYRKINKRRRAVSCEASEGTDSGSRGCCGFQLPLVYNQVCWDVFDTASGFSVLKNGPRGLRDFSGHFLGPGGRAGWFCVVFGVREARGGSFGVTNPKRDILVAV